MHTLMRREADIHIAPGQEQHLPHEAWHVAQQKQGRVQATTQMKGAGINDDVSLEKEAVNVRAEAMSTPVDPLASGYEHFNKSDLGEIRAQSSLTAVQKKGRQAIQFNKGLGGEKHSGADPSETKRAPVEAKTPDGDGKEVKAEVPERATVTRTPAIDDREAEVKTIDTIKGRAGLLRELYKASKFDEIAAVLLEARRKHETPTGFAQMMRDNSISAPRDYMITMLSSCAETQNQLSYYIMGKGAPDPVNASFRKMAMFERVPESKGAPQAVYEFSLIFEALMASSKDSYFDLSWCGNGSHHFTIVKLGSAFDFYESDASPTPPLLFLPFFDGSRPVKPSESGASLDLPGLHRNLHHMAERLSKIGDRVKIPDQKFDITLRPM
jgi:hypothetical protein